MTTRTEPHDPADVGDVPAPSASTSARALARDHLTRAIVASARAQLATVGPAALSVRAVARDVGMASSAVYRYFPSRDELLTALLVEGFDEQGAAVEAAAAAADPDDLLGRWSGVAHAFRGWAVAHPHDYALLYGSPVPGYVAPRRTVGPATRVTRVLLGLLADGAARDVPAATTAVPSGSPELHASVAGVRALAGGEVDDDVLLAGLTAWAGLVGGVTLELFGHLENAVGDRDVWFDGLVRRLYPFARARAA